MKSSRIYAILLIAIVMAGVLHAKKNNISGEEENIDKMRTGLSEIAKLVPEDRPVALNVLSPNVEIYLWCRYVLAPRYCPPVTQSHSDTVLTVSPQFTSDSALQNAIAGRKILWQNKDELYSYYLTCTNHKL